MPSAIPIVIGPLFDMSSIEVMQLMQRTFFIMGVACFLQGWIGHKMPIVDGPAGIWVSTFAVFAGTISTATGSAENSLRLLEMAMILTGIFLMLFGLFKISGKIISIFIPSCDRCLFNFIDCSTGWHVSARNDGCC